MPKKTIPAVSIVIPMYNAEKYIGACLDSIFAQTFTDFEVIVVDDCSTDNSVKVVENYFSTFRDKLKLIRRKINSGGEGTPRNMGVGISRGEYISFIDSDDMISPTALEELYPIAKKFDADVVHCERFFQFNDGENKFTVEGYQTGELVKEPTFLTDNLAERVQDLYNRRFLWNAWSKLIRREYIMNDNLTMINGMAHDAHFLCCLVCSAKNYVRVPNIISFYRLVENSLTHEKQDVSKVIRKWVNALTKGFQSLDKFLSEREFFQKRPDVKYLALEVWVRECCGYLQEIYAQNPSFQFDELLRKEFEGNALMAFIFSRMNIFNVNLIKQNQIIQQLQAQLKSQ